MLPNPDFHHPTTWWFDWGLPWATRLLQALQLATTTGWSWSFVPLPQTSARMMIFRWDCFAGRPKTNHMLWVMIKMYLKQTWGGGCSFWWKGKLDSNDFDFVSDYCFIILKASKFQKLNSFPMFSKLFKRESHEKLGDWCVPNQSESRNDSNLDFHSSWVAMGCITVDFPIS